MEPQSFASETSCKGTCNTCGQERLKLGIKDKTNKDKITSEIKHNIQLLWPWNPVFHNDNHSREIISTTANQQVRLNSCKYEHVIFSKSDGQLDPAFREENTGQFYIMNPDILWIWESWVIDFSKIFPSYSRS